MKIKLSVLYDLARTVPYNEFESILKATVCKRPPTEKIDGELETEINLRQ